jgi:prepilin-type N-terminal cleavage/methylation domain-containing protein
MKAPNVGNKASVRAGFTLVELLVVIGIIALLISILMPALNKAHVQAQLTVCKSQLRQNGLAIMMYANDNKGRYPPGVLFNFPFAMNRGAAPWDPATTGPSAEEMYYGNLLKQYAGAVVKTFYCPFQPYVLPADGSFFPAGAHYWTGYYYFGDYPYDFAVPTELARTVDDFWYAERVGDGPRTKLMQDWTDTLSWNHEQVNSLYTDGSVAAEKIAELKVRVRAGGRGPKW